MKRLIIFASLLSGCSAVPAPDIDYAAKIDAAININNQQLELKKHALDKLIELEKEKISSDKEVKIKELELAALKGNHLSQDIAKTVEMPDYSHCEEYRDEYQERFSNCLEDKIKSISSMDMHQSENISVPTISGDNNTVMVSSPGAEINQDGRSYQQKQESRAVSAIMGLFNNETFAPLPKQPVHKHPVAQAIDSVTSLAKETAYPILYGVLGWKGIGALEAGIEKDSFRMDGDITTDSNNPVTTTTTTYPPQVAE